MKRGRKIVVLILFFFATVALAQSNMIDVVYLKNGSIIRGMITEQVPNQSIKIQTKDNNVFFFKLEEVDKITKEPEQGVFKQKGFVNITEYIICIGQGKFSNGINTTENDAISSGLRTVNGYQFNPFISAGIGLGIDIYKDFEMIPITFDFRISPISGRATPILTLNGGYSIGTNDFRGSGYIFNPSLGMKVFVSKKLACYLSIGYKWQAWKTTYVDVIFTNDRIRYYPRKVSHNFEFLSFSTGISF
jgi:hypothetical protein